MNLFMFSSNELLSRAEQSKATAASRGARPPPREGSSVGGPQNRGGGTIVLVGEHTIGIFFQFNIIVFKITI